MEVDGGELDASISNQSINHLRNRFYSEGSLFSSRSAPFSPPSILTMSEGKDDQPVVGSAAQPAADVVRERAPGFQPRVGIVLGSGMGDVGGIIEDAITISYADRKH